MELKLPVTEVSQEWGVNTGEQRCSCASKEVSVASLFSPLVCGCSQSLILYLSRHISLLMFMHEQISIYSSRTVRSQLLLT